MGTIFDYLDWRGDLTMQADPFNEADNLLLNELVYAHIEDYVTREERVTIGEAAVRYFSHENNPDFVLGVEALRQAGASARFKDLELYHLESTLNRKNQFAAVCLDLPDGRTYIFFRGTDETIAGWREDFAISYTETLAQKMAVEYLGRILEEGKKKRKDCGQPEKFIVGGHSKGGNLAVYSCMRMDAEKQAMISEIYNLDGPGITPEQLDEAGFERIRRKIRRYIPSYSVVGRLFEQDIRPMIIDNCAKGILQHDAKNWMVLGTHMVRTDEIPPDCKMTNSVFREWIDSTDMEEREAFTKDFFDALEGHDKETMIEFEREGLKGVLGVVGSISSFSPPAKKAVNKLLKSASRNTLVSGAGKISASMAWLSEKAKQGMENLYVKRSRLFEEYPVLKNEKIMLRKIVPQDALSLKELTLDERVYDKLPAYLYENRYEDKQRVIARMDRECFASQESVLLAICLLPEENRMIGIAEIYNYEPKKQKASIGCRMKSEYWGQGIATDVAALLKDYLLNGIGLRTITAHVMQGNLGSDVVLSKNGFRKRYPNIRENWGFDEPVLTDKYVFKRAWLDNPDEADRPAEIEQFVVAYRVEQDRIRAMLPEGFVSLRPVLRISAEIRDEDSVYLELNTPVAKDGLRGWLNIENWKSTRGDELQFTRNGSIVQFTTPFLALSCKLTGREGARQAENDNDGCYYIRNKEEEFRPSEKHANAELEFCDITFSWHFRRKDAAGVSTGKTMMASSTPVRKKYRKCALSAKNAAAIPCEEVLDAFVLRFERKPGHI